MNRKLLQQALTVLKDWDALIKHQYSGSSEAMTDMQHAAWNTVDAIKALEAELAKPEQDYIKQLEDGFRKQLDELSERNYKLKFELADIKLDKIDKFDAQPEQDHGFDRTASHMASEYVDTAEQEPVAWMLDFIDDGFEVKDHVVTKPEHIGAGYNVRTLYTSPPCKEPVATVTKIMHNGTYYEGYFDSHIRLKVGTKLYTSPPRKEWVCKKCGEINDK